MDLKWTELTPEGQEDIVRAVSRSFKGDHFTLIKALFNICKPGIKAHEGLLSIQEDSLSMLAKLITINLNLKKAQRCQHQQ